MTLNYVYSESMDKPLSIEFTDSTVYLRKNFVEKKMPITGNVNGEITYWTYEEAALTPEEFNKYSDEIIAVNAINGQDDSAKINNIETGVKLSDMNQLDLMEAVTEIYEMMLANQA